MFIDRLTNDKGEFRCFRLDNRIISRAGMAKVVSRLDGAKVLRFPRFYDDEVFCVFEFMGKEFEVTEPYGDSSYFDIVGPEDSHEEMSIIASHFESSDPIKGGDLGHDTYFLITWCVRSLIFMGVVYVAYQGCSRISN